MSSIDSENETEYLRIGTIYYRKIRKPLASGDVILKYY